MDAAKAVGVDIDSEAESGNVSAYVPNPKKESPERIAIRKRLAAYPSAIRKFANEELINLDVSDLNKVIADLPAELPGLIQRFKNSIARSPKKIEVFKEEYQNLDEAFVRQAVDYVVELRKLYR